MTSRLTTITVCLACVLAMGSPALAQSYGTELPFAAGAGARASAMGLAGTSLPGTPSTQFLNPALLATQQRTGFEFYRTTLFDSDAQYHALGYVYPSLDWGTLGVTVLRLDVGGIEERDASNLLLSSDISNNQTRFLLGYGLDVLPTVKAGANLKVDRHALGDLHGTAVGLDVGFVVTRALTDMWWLQEVRGSLVAENLLEPSVKLIQDDVPDPRRVSIGASADGRQGDIGFSTALDVVSPRYSPTELRFGQEVSYRDMFFARFGWDGTTATFGLGGAYHSISVDYAYLEEDLGSNHRVSLAVMFGPSLEDRAATRRAMADHEIQRRVAAKVVEFETTQLDRMLKEGDALFSSGDYKAAREKYELVLMWDTEHPHATARIVDCDVEAAIVAAEAAFARAEFVEALRLYQKAAELDSSDARATKGIAECEAMVAAIEDRAQVIGRMLSQAIDSYAAGNYLDAQSGLQDVLRIDPDNRIAGEFAEKCRTSTDASLARLMSDAASQEKRGDYSAAIATLQQAAALSPDPTRIRKQISSLREQQRKLERAAVVEDTEPAATSQPLPPVDEAVLDRKYEAGIASFERGNFGEAARSLLQVWTVAPSYRGVTEPLVRSLLLEGMRLYSEGRYGAAIDTWQRVLTVSPDNAKARRYLRKAMEESSRLGGGSK